MHSQRRPHRSLRMTMGVILALLLVTAMIIPVSAAPQAPADDFSLTILHTNDTHANIEPCTTSCLGADLGGVARRYTAIQSVKAEGGNVAVIFALMSLPLFGIVGGAVLVGTAGILAARSVVSHPPMQALRADF